MRQRRYLLLMTTTALMLAACAASPTRFYTLAGANAMAVRPVASSSPQRHLFVEMMPVSVPDRLARPQIVVRADSVRVEVLEQDRWSAPFNIELRDALASGVANRLGAVDVTRGGRPPGQPVYRVAIELRQMDGIRGGKIDAAFGWTITRSDTDSNAVCRMSVTDVAQGADIAGLVSGMQRIVATAADAISADIVMLQEGKSGACSSQSGQ